MIKVSILLGAFLILFSPFEIKAGSPDLLFQASLTRTTEAEKASGDATPYKGTARAEADGAAIGFNDPSVQYENLAYGREGNINLEAGTVEFWFKPKFERTALDGNTSIYYLFGLSSEVTDQNNAPRQTVIAITENNGSKALRAFYGAKEAKELAYAIPWEAGEWHHIALTWDAERIMLFVDGKQAASQPTAGGLFDGDKEAKEAVLGNFAIGGLIDCGIDCSANGWLREVKIYDRPIYNDDFEPKRP